MLLSKFDWDNVIGFPSVIVELKEKVIERLDLDRVFRDGSKLYIKRIYLTP